MHQLIKLHSLSFPSQTLEMWLLRRRRRCCLLAIASLCLLPVLLFLLHDARLVQTPPDAWSSVVISRRITDILAAQRPTPPVNIPLNFSIECNVLPPSFGSPERRLTRHAPPVSASCDLLFKGDPAERRRVRSVMDGWKSYVSDKQFLRGLASNCTRTRQQFYDNFYTSRVEREFPLAYIFLVHHKEGLIKQYLRLMKFLYRPHNAYCVHMDLKAPKWWKILVLNFASCFPNVIIASESVNVVYGTVRILHAHLSCFRELVKSSHPWRYAINLHSTEIPLATNRELVELAMSMKGVNIIDVGENTSSTWASQAARRKVQNSITWNLSGSRTYHKRSSFQTPFNVSIFKSAASANSALTREFVQFMLTDNRAKTLVRYLHDFESAVELFFSTVNHFHDAPGNRYLLRGRKMPLLAQRIWKFQTLNGSPLCKERRLFHRICIVSSSDLPWLREVMEKKQFYFFNKYWIDYDHVVMDCIENLLVERNVEEHIRDCGSVESALEKPA